jgi:hypothetical protein
MQVPANRKCDHTSCERRNPAKLDLNAGTRREQRRIDQACLIFLFTDATDHHGPAGDIPEDAPDEDECYCPYCSGARTDRRMAHL